MIISNIKISNRLFLATALFIVPLIFAVYLFITTIDSQIDFSKQEVKGNIYLSPIVNSMLNLNELVLFTKTQNNQEIKNKIVALDKITDTISSLQNLEIDLKLDDELLKYKNKENIKPTLLIEQINNFKKQIQQGSQDNKNLADLISSLMTAATYIGDSSNLILDPDLDSYYTMDAVLIALPQTVVRYNTLMNKILPLLKKNNLSNSELQSIGIIAALFKESDIARVQADFEVVFKEDKNFYDVSPTLQPSIEPALNEYVKTNNDLVELLENIANNTTQVDTNELLNSLILAENSTFNLWNISSNELGILLQKRIEFFNDQKTTKLVQFIIILIIAFGIYFYITTSIKNPLININKAMQAIAGGNLDLQVPFTNLKDEIGEMAQTLQIFKDTSIKAKELNEQQIAKFKSEMERKNIIDKAIANFEAISSSVINAISDASTEMSMIIDNTMIVSKKADTDTKDTMSLTAETSKNVSVISNSLEEFTKAINEISTQINKAASASNEAIREKEIADISMKKLTEAANNISEIMNFIDNITNNINLLALNATIESARAGEAGKGFAVVASEVKNLANQASQASEKIKQQVNDVQNLVKESATRLDMLIAAVNTTNSISTTIASSVEEQTATSREISTNLNQANNKVQNVTEKLNKVNCQTTTMKENAEEILLSSKNFNDKTSVLQKAVIEFLKSIKTQ